MPLSQMTKEIQSIQCLPCLFWITLRPLRQQVWWEKAWAIHGLTSSGIYWSGSSGSAAGLWRAPLTPKGLGRGGGYLIIPPEPGVGKIAHKIASLRVLSLCLHYNERVNEFATIETSNSSPFQWYSWNSASNFVEATVPLGSL